MATVNVITGDQKVTGDLQVSGTIKPPRPRTELQQQALAVHAIPLTEFRTWDAMAVNLPATGGADDLGLYFTGTWGTHAPKISTGDVKNLGATTRRASIVRALPPNYEAAETVNLRISAATETTVASVSSTVDVEAYLVGRDGTIDGSDLISTAAQNINSTSWADFTFVIDAATLAPGDELFLRITIAVNDSGTGTVVQPSIGAVELLCDTR